MRLKRLFCTNKIEPHGMGIPFVGVDLETNTCYDALETPGGYNGWGTALHIGSPLSIGQLRQYAQEALDDHADDPERIAPYLHITEEAFLQRCGALKKSKG